MNELDKRNTLVVHWNVTTHAGSSSVSGRCIRFEFVIRIPVTQKTNMIETVQTPRVELNNIAEKSTKTCTLPDQTTPGDIIDLGEVLYKQLAELIESYAETQLTRREAEVWVLSTFVGGDHARLTDEAIALLLATPGCPFGEQTELTPDEDIAASPSVAEIEQRYERAKNKYEQAKQFVGSETFRNRGEHLDSPQIIWTDWSTHRRLEGRLNPEDQTVDDLLNRLLDETETRPSLEELTRSYLDARGRENVAQVAVSVPSGKGRTLSISAHTGVNAETPDVITETDAVTINEDRYDFHFDEDPYGPHEGKHRLSLYAADNITGMDAVRVDDGIKTVRDRMQQETKKSGEKIDS